MPEQLEFFAIPSPCRGVCQSDARGYCLGCFRSRQERFEWGNMDDSQKQDVLRLCRQRFLRMRRGGNKTAPADDAPNQPNLL
ncbi:DUF1289 domain-containing protein [Martelella alba]|uniref:DUF1289 domain-containing protein n=1 Tax=Martelella alba TaxID=2590451 RepID=A0ABY2SMM1_9HYPH|nr:DUF1289 domain-containing protein [Martelella alba]TKI05649.1 DUF1289 domain-containing protein [Martelella alba]